jgi:peptidoglycan/LPS O-acetylase OafA/YrhL
MRGSTALPGPAHAKSQDLQILRGIAVLLVVLEHYGASDTIALALGVHCPFYSGVDLFFVISGFVVPESFARIDWNASAFMIKRIFRLWPVLFVVLAQVIAINWLFDHVPWSQSGRSFYFTEDHDAILIQWISVLCGFYPIATVERVYGFGPLWSLVVEVRFYAFLAILAFFLRRHLTDPKRAIGFVITAIFAVTTAGRVGVALGFPRLASLPLLGTLLDQRYDFILAGVTLWRFQKASGVVTANLRTFTILAFLGIIAALTFNAFLGSASTPGAGLSGWGRLVLLVVFTFAVWIASQNTFRSVMPAKLARALSIVGDWSYTIYVLHLSLLILFWLFAFNFAIWMFDTKLAYCVSEILIHSILLWPLVWLVYRYIEMPLNRLGSVVASRFTQDAAARLAASP